MNDDLTQSNVHDGRSTAVLLSMLTNDDGNDNGHHGTDGRVGDQVRGQGGGQVGQVGQVRQVSQVSQVNRVGQERATRRASMEDLLGHAEVDDAGQKMEPQTLEVAVEATQASQIIQGHEADNETYDDYHDNQDYSVTRNVNQEVYDMLANMDSATTFGNDSLSKLGVFGMGDSLTLRQRQTQAQQQGLQNQDSLSTLGYGLADSLTLLHQRPLHRQSSPAVTNNSATSNNSDSLSTIGFGITDSLTLRHNALGHLGHLRRRSNDQGNYGRRRSSNESASSMTSRRRSNESDCYNGGMLTSSITSRRRSNESNGCNSARRRSSNESDGYSGSTSSRRRSNESNGYNGNGLGGLTGLTSSITSRRRSNESNGYNGNDSLSTLGFGINDSLTLNQRKTQAAQQAVLRTMEDSFANDSMSSFNFGIDDSIKLGKLRQMQERQERQHPQHQERQPTMATLLTMEDSATTLGMDDSFSSFLPNDSVDLNHLRLDDLPLTAAPSLPSLTTSASCEHGNLHGSHMRKNSSKPNLIQLTRVEEESHESHGRRGSCFTASFSGSLDGSVGRKRNTVMLRQDSAGGQSVQSVQSIQSVQSVQSQKSQKSTSSAQSAESAPSEPCIESPRSDKSRWSDKSSTSEVSEVSESSSKCSKFSKSTTSEERSTKSTQSESTSSSSMSGAVADSDKESERESEREHIGTENAESAGKAGNTESSTGVTQEQKHMPLNRIHKLRRSGKRRGYSSPQA